MNKKMN